MTRVCEVEWTLKHWRIGTEGHTNKRGEGGARESLVQLIASVVVLHDYCINLFLQIYSQRYKDTYTKTQTQAVRLTGR